MLLLLRLKTQVRAIVQSWWRRQRKKPSMRWKVAAKVTRLSLQMYVLRLIQKELHHPNRIALPTKLRCKFFFSKSDLNTHNFLMFFFFCVRVKSKGPATKTDTVIVIALQPKLSPLAAKKFTGLKRKRKNLPTRQRLFLRLLIRRMTRVMTLNPGSKVTTSLVKPVENSILLSVT